MRIVDLEAFRALPAGVLYAKYRPCTFDNLSIKGDTWEHDFLTLSVIEPSFVGDMDCGERCATLDAMSERGESRAIEFDSYGRDGMFDKDQLFAVWERDDVAVLIEQLQGTLLVSPAPEAPASVPARVPLPEPDPLAVRPTAEPNPHTP